MSMQTIAVLMQIVGRRYVVVLIAAGVHLAVVVALAAPGKVINGLLLGSVIALGAIGITLIYSILRFAHVAHGEYMTLGAYATLFMLTVVFPPLGIDSTGFGPFTFGYPLLLALPAAMAVVIGAALLLDLLVYRRLRARGSNLVMMAMVSLGIAIAMRGIVQAVWGTDPTRYPRVSRQFYHIEFDIPIGAAALPFDIRVPPDNLFLGLMAVVLALALYLFLNRTRTGKAMRATSDNMELARVSGINTTRIIYWTWAIAAAYAAIAGALLAVSQAQLLPHSGWKVLIPLFAAVTLGGIGKPWGALAGGLIIGVSTEASTEWVSPAYKPAIAFTIMLGALLLRPQGLFGDRNA